LSIVTLPSKPAAAGGHVLVPRFVAGVYQKMREARARRLQQHSSEILRRRTVRAAEVGEARELETLVQRERERGAR
jgi:hypothetical protein